MEIQRHFIDANGNHFVAPFDSQEKANAYQPPEGAVEVQPRPSPEHVWIGGQWVLVDAE